jgi:hypothetical protein
MEDSRNARLLVEIETAFLSFGDAIYGIPEKYKCF